MEKINLMPCLTVQMTDTVCIKCGITVSIEIQVAHFKKENKKTSKTYLTTRNIGNIIQNIAIILKQ